MAPIIFFKTVGKFSLLLILPGFAELDKTALDGDDLRLHFGVEAREVRTQKRRNSSGSTTAFDM